MKDIDLVFSGSGVRLGCHYGALLAIRKKYNIVRIAGTSGGAIIAAANSCFTPIEDLWHVINDIDFNKLMCDGKLTSWIRLIKEDGLYKGDDFQNYIEKYITKGLYLKDKPELNIIVTDLTNKVPIVMNSKSFPNIKISEAVRMSMSAPIYWIPKYLMVNNEKRVIIDGGISANYYIDLFDDNSRQTIGIILYTKIKKKSKIEIFNYFRNILDTLMESNEHEHIDDAHWASTIKIDTEDITPFNLDITKEQINWTIKHGYEVTNQILHDKIEKGDING